MSTPVSVGFFGKLPSRGDFVRAGLSRGFVAEWDLWLQQVLPPCRGQLGGDWDWVWSAASAWRFAVPGQALGLLLPSIDRAGRQFPLIIAAEGADQGDGFLDAAEQVGWDALARELEPDALFAWLQALPLPGAAGAVAGRTTRWWTGPEKAAGEEPLMFDGLPDAVALAGMLAR